MNALRIDICFIIIGLINFSCKAPSNNQKPNIILFVVDDLGWTDLGYMGNTYNSTPNIDRLANEGTIFTDAYSNAPNCAPTRACLLSGQYSPRHGVYTVGSPERGKSMYRKLIPSDNKTELTAENMTFGEVLQDNGYVTAHFGKWHLGDGPTGPLNRGFDFNYAGNRAGNPKSYFSPYNNKNLADGPDGEYLTDRLANEAISFIEHNKDSTFFIYFPFYNVHTPLQAKSDLIAKYEPKDCDRIKCNPTYAAMVESVDQAVGTVFNKIVETGLSQNTIILFTSDNGPFLPASTAEPLRGSKGMLYEGGIRIPMFIWHPKYNGIVKKTEIPVISIDFFPTLLDLVSIDKPEEKELDGKSLVPIIKNETFYREHLYWHFPAYLQRYAGVNHIFRTAPAGAMRKDHWKIIEFFEDRTVELYNLDLDISESHDVSKQYPDITEQMLKELESWRESTNAPIPTEINPEFDQTLYETRLNEIKADLYD